MEEWAKREFRTPGTNWWPGLYIISGARTPAQNSAVNGAQDSRHLQCPSSAADLRVGTVSGLPDGEVWAILGGWWRLHGGRWGGSFSWEGSPLPNPKEWNHFDLG